MLNNRTRVVITLPISLSASTGKRGPEYKMSTLRGTFDTYFLKDVELNSLVVGQGLKKREDTNFFCKGSTP